MSALLAGLLANPTILAIIAGILGALGWGFSQRRAGAKAERAKQAERETAARDIRDEVQNDIGAMPADKVRAELAKRAAK
jgi:hypothetical protein